LNLQVTLEIRQRNSNNHAARALRDKLGSARPASTKERTSGATVNDKTGIAMATIVSVGADGVILATVTGKVKIPADAFGRNDAGLLLDMTKGDFDKIVAKANASS
jgi:NAD kinase